MTANCLHLLLPVLICVTLWPTASVVANTSYYQTLKPPLPPPPVGARNRPGVLDQWLDLPLRGGAQVRKMVVLADEPRQAALAALGNPVLGVSMANQALTAGRAAERSQQVTCVDLYFEGVAFSWNFLRSPGAAHRPEYAQAWKIYHHCLARLISSAQRFGRLDPQRGLQVVTPMGSRTISTSYHGFVWQSTDFTRVEVANDSGPKKLEHHYRHCGLGVPLVVVRKSSKNERFLENTIPFNATAILRPSLEAIAGRAPPVGAGSSHGPLEFHDPLRVKTVPFDGQRIAMARNTSAALEYAVREDRGGPWCDLMRAGPAEPGREKLFLLEPYQPGKYPVVFVHGLHRSPQILAEFANEILARPDLRRRIQLVGYRYPTGRPLLESAAALRHELLALKQTYDPRGEDPGIANTAVVGHSTGGLVAKLTATYSDDRLWYSIARRSLSEITVSAERRNRLRDLFYFKPVPFVRRVVFVGTPHRGTQLASRTVGQWTADRAQLPPRERIEHDRLIKQNPGVFKPEVADRLPNSMDLMDRNSCLLRTIKVLCTGRRVQLHNILAVGRLSPFSGRGDGIVPQKSAQHHSVSTEKQISTSHANLHETDEAVQELACILRRHVLEAHDVPTTQVREDRPFVPSSREQLMPPLPSDPVDALWPKELRPPTFGAPAPPAARPKTSDGQSAQATSRSQPSDSDQAKHLTPLPRLGVQSKPHPASSPARPPVPSHETGRPASGPATDATDAVEASGTTSDEDVEPSQGTRSDKTARDEEHEKPPQRKPGKPDASFQGPELFFPGPR